MSSAPTPPKQMPLVAEAVAFVERLCAGAGWPTERIAIGADVEIRAIIPSQCGLPDFTLWIACEAKLSLSRFRQGGAQYVVPVARDVLLRSFARRESTALILWDGERKSAFWMFPQHSVGELTLLREEAPRVDVTFLDRLPLTAREIDRIASIVRIERCESILALALGQGHLGTASEAESETVEIMFAGALFHSLAVLDLLAETGLTPRALERFRSTKEDVLEEISSGALEADEDEVDEVAVARLVEDRIAELSGGLIGARNIEAYAPDALAAILAAVGEMAPPRDDP
jgi:hypothetical protein